MSSATYSDWARLRELNQNAAELRNLGLTAAVANALARVGLDVRMLGVLSNEQLLKVRGVGSWSIDRIRERVPAPALPLPGFRLVRPDRNSYRMRAETSAPEADVPTSFESAPLSAVPPRRRPPRGPLSTIPRRLADLPAGQALFVGRTSANRSLTALQDRIAEVCRLNVGPGRYGTRQDHTKDGVWIFPRSRS